MRDQYDWQGEFITQALKVRQHLITPEGIDCRQRFIQQQQARLRQQRTSQCNSLAFAARELPAAPPQHWSEVKQIDDPLHRNTYRMRPRAPQSIAEIPGNVQMREQTQILEHTTDVPSMRRHIHSRCGIEQQFPVQ